jgi:hypothetical protein
MATRGAWFGDQRTDLDVRSAQGRHFNGYLSGGIAGPCMSEGMQAVSRIVARLVDLDLPNLKNIYLDLAIHGRQQH